MRLVITGFMGCGKSRISRELSKRLDLKLIDLDERITQLYGRSPAQLIKEDGEAMFRAMETKALREVLRTNAAAVIALGGGAWIKKKNRDLIAQYGCLSVWLDAPFEICWYRIKASGEDRPLAPTREQARALYNRRRPVYQLANIHAQVPVNREELISRIVSHG
ncbi:MAG TPA: shikimate kinase [Pyrinomonadaceae bacterium]|nr:shikimate kinase [Pyrinomonadaceae bacterium]